MKKNDFRRRADRSLSALTWTDAQRRKVLRRIAEEERPMRKLKWSAVAAIALICMTLAGALAAGLVYGPGVQATMMAEQALLEEWGITQDMLTFFARTVERQENGHIVTYEGYEGLDGVLGMYTVTVRDGAAETVWSLAGVSTEGGFDARAWGKDQLKEMLRLKQETGTGRVFHDKARGMADPMPTPQAQSEDAFAAEQQRFAALAVLGEESMVDAAREAVRQVHQLTDTQAAKLIHEPLMSCYHMMNGNLCYDVNLQLQQADAGGLLDVPYTDKDGVYTVTVNAETGVIESVLYESALGGNG